MPASPDKEPAEPVPAGSGPVPIKAIPVRHYGRWLGAAVAVALLALLVRAFAGANINWDTVNTYLTHDTILEGAANTLLISVVSMLLGLVLGVLLAIMRLSDNPVLRSVSWFYIWVFRGTPVLVQLMIWFQLALIFPTFNVGFYSEPMKTFMTPFLAALLGLGLNEAAYMAEIVRAGILSVDEGQTEASHALGMSKAKTMRRVVLPQAMRVIIPPTGNEYINLLKTSSLASAVQYNEVLKRANDISSSNLQYVELLFVAAFWYLVLTSIFSIGQFYLERHYAKGSLRSLPDTPIQKVKRMVFTLRRPEVPRS
ncbi:amino acid ABC transporter permease [Yinghuangia sp. YIM S09857]|uniref:amino acid ABC transporter permease n=1 Tax=Yinghuangia sp. YIM S09857 TaxID=3436929 RepID=UPI003F536BB7